MLELLSLAAGYATVAAFLFGVNQWVRSTFPDQYLDEREKTLSSNGILVPEKHEESKLKERKAWFSGRKILLKSLEKRPIRRFLTKLLVSNRIRQSLNITTLVALPLLQGFLILNELTFVDWSWQLTTGSQPQTVYVWNGAELISNGAVILSNLDIMAICYLILLFSFAYNGLEIRVWLKAASKQAEIRSEVKELDELKILHGQDPGTPAIENQSELPIRRKSSVETGFD